MEHDGNDVLEDVDSHYTMNDEGSSDSKNSEEYIEEETSQPMTIQEEQKIQVKFDDKTLGMIVAKGNSKLWVDTINTESLKKKIQVKDIIRTINGTRVGNKLSAIQPSIRPMHIECISMVLVEVLEDEATEYYTDKELRNKEEIPNEIGIDNIDIESGGEGESMDLKKM